MDNFGTNYETNDVMQTIEDAFIREIKRVMPSTYKIFSNPMKQNIKKDSVILVLQVMNMGRSSISNKTRRRTVLYDIAIVTDEGPYWIEERLMDIGSISFGDITKVLTSARFSRVDGVTHMSGYFYVAEITG